jgi:hypothetical protein
MQRMDENDAAAERGRAVAPQRAADQIAEGSKVWTFREAWVMQTITHLQLMPSTDGRWTSKAKETALGLTKFFLLVSQLIPHSAANDVYDRKRCQEITQLLKKWGSQARNSIKKHGLGYEAPSSYKDTYHECILEAVLVMLRGILSDMEGDRDLPKIPVQALLELELNIAYLISVIAPLHEVFFKMTERILPIHMLSEPDTSFSDKYAYLKPYKAVQQEASRESERIDASAMFLQRTFGHADFCAWRNLVQHEIRKQEYMPFIEYMPRLLLLKTMWQIAPAFYI